MLKNCMKDLVPVYLARNRLGFSALVLLDWGGNHLGVAAPLVAVLVGGGRLGNGLAIMVLANTARKAVGVKTKHFALRIITPACCLTLGLG